MTSAETQTILNAIHTQIDGKSGDIYGISITPVDIGGIAQVNISWEAFQSNFLGQTADRHGKIWSKTIGNITYSAKEVQGPTSDTVPA